MKIAYGSDTHIEFGPFDPVNRNGSNVLVLAGDICVNETFLSNKADEFFDKCSSEFEHVIYVVGNHEYYHGNFDATIEDIKNKLSSKSNIHVLENEYIDIDNFRFLGCTLWTNANNNDPITESVINRSMTDYKIVTIFDKVLGRYRNLRAEDTIKKYNESIAFIENNIDETKVNIVVSHHAPYIESIHENYKYDFHMNGAYVTNLYNFISERDIALWFHGHTHFTTNYMIEHTLVLTNQRGYIGQEAMANDFDFKEVELEEV